MFNVRVPLTRALCATSQEHRAEQQEKEAAAAQEVTFNEGTVAFSEEEKEWLASRDENDVDDEDDGGQEASAADAAGEADNAGVNMPVAMTPEEQQWMRARSNSGADHVEPGDWTAYLPSTPGGMPANVDPAMAQMQHTQQQLQFQLELAEQRAREAEQARIQQQHDYQLQMQKMQSEQAIQSMQAKMEALQTQIAQMPVGGDPSTPAPRGGGRAQETPVSGPSTAPSQEASPYKRSPSKPRCKYGASCTRKNPQHFADEDHPDEHPLLVSCVPCGPSGAAQVQSQYKRAPGKKLCQFGAKCFQKNPQHWADEDHPDDHPLLVSNGGGSSAPNPYQRAHGNTQCKFGSKCTRKDPQHFKDYDHPSDHPLIQSSAAPSIKVKENPYQRALGKPQCRFGTSCQRDAPDHFREYDHPDEHPKFGKSNRFPVYWERKKAFMSKDFHHLHPIKDSDDVFTALSNCLQSFDKGQSLNYGRDVPAGHPNYKGLKLLAAWRNENIPEWEKYIAQKKRIEREMARLQQAKVRASVDTRLKQVPGGVGDLPGALNPLINETYLLHGTKSETVFDILSSGTNKNFSGGLFGEGTYFAEDAGKNNQYVFDESGQNDNKYYGNDKSSPLNPLHVRLFGKKVPHPKGSDDCFADDSFGPQFDNVYYLVLCRVILGMPVFTKDGSISTEDGASVWAKPKKQPAKIPGVQAPAIFYHSLIAEKGVVVQRHREFILFHDEPVYPEYVLCYRRTTQ